MSRYAYIKGWFECPFSLVDEVKKVNNRFFHLNKHPYLDESQIELYSKGWQYPTVPINWVNYIFYGACVNIIAIDFIKEMIINSSLVNEIEGCFFIDIEDDCSYTWVISNGKLIEKKQNQ